MEAFGEPGANSSAGTDVTGFSAAAQLRGRGLRSVPSAGGSAAIGSAKPGPASVGPAPAGLGCPALATTDLEAALALLDSAITSAPEELASANFLQAADFAELTEELSRRIEYLQLQAASAVDRTRTEAINAAGSASRAAGWTTGWGADPEPAAGPSDATTTSAAADSDASKSADAPAVPALPARSLTWSPADDGARNTADFLRTRLRISTPEARRRLALANATLPRTGLAGRPMPPAHEETAAALTAGIIASRAGTIITTALDKVRHIPDPDTLAEMEHNLTQTAIENDHDFLTRIAHRWIDALDQDGTEPSEENLRHRQGIFLHRKRGGLHHFEVHATTDQYEVLTTVMNTATNPRTTTPNTTGFRSDGSREGPVNEDTGHESGDNSGDSAAVDPDTAFNAPDPEPDLDRRTLAQQRLDGLVGASKAALATGTLPTTGGLRPQVMVTVSYRDLLNSIETTAAQGPRYAPNANRPDTRPTDSTQPTNTPWQATINPPTGPDTWQTGPDTSQPTEPEPEPEPGTHPNTRQASDPDPLAGTRPDTRQACDPEPRTGTGTGFPAASTPDAAPPGIHRPGTGLFGTPTGSGTFTYTGPVTASTIRKIACDADIIPVLLGTEGRILDIGRTTRVFPPHIRKALNARDQGCAFPNCTIPAPWCEAHHITYWSRGGPTSTDNGVLLCTHHHHLIHKEQWRIHVKTGIPWFIPPPHIDPRQQPRQNHHHKT